MRYVVGLTGGIGSGKSTVANLFAELGAGIVDTDAIAHELTGPGGGAIAAIAAAFGAEVIAATGALDRRAMRERVFADPPAKKRLEAILHPMIREISDHRIAEAQAPYVILAVPLLVESGAYGERVDRVLVVDCDAALQVSRVMQRSGLTEAAVRAIIATQASRDERLAAADDVIVNSGGAEALRGQVAALHRKYLEFAGTA